MELRASRLPLLTKCSGALYLPNEEYESDNAKRASEWGRMAHSWKETGEVNGPSTRTENAFRKAVSLSGISRTALWPSGGKHEQKVALRVDGARKAVVDTSVEGLSGEWLTGTDDFQWWLFDELWIDDLKTGKSYPDPQTGVNRYPQDPASAQLKAYALAVATVLDHRGVTNVSITHWPRLPLESRHSQPERTWIRYTRDALDQFWVELERVYAEWGLGLEGTYTLNPGDHCRFCPARNFCLEAEQFPSYSYTRS